MQRKLYEALASAINARKNCAANLNNSHASTRENAEHWHAEHAIRANMLVNAHMPHGSGFDNGTRLDWDQSRDDRLVFLTSFHHMNESGMYDGWADYSVIVKPSFIGGFDMRITGRDRNDIKEYIGQVFHDSLTTIVEE